MDVCEGLFGGDADAIWPLLLAFGDEREAAAFLATAAKVARRACQERARPGGDRKACAAVMTWLEGMSSYAWGAADHVAERIAVERGFREDEPSTPVQEQGREETAATDGCSGGGGDGGGDSDDGGGGGSGSGSGGNGGGGGGGPSRLRGNGGGESEVSNSDHSGSGSGGGGGGGIGGSIGDGRCIHGSAGDTDTGAAACGGEGGVRTSNRTPGCGGSDGGCTDGGGGGPGSGNHGCGDGLGEGGSTDGSAAPPTSGISGGRGNVAAAASATAAPAATTAAAGSLSPPEQQLMRLLSFALPLWLPLWLDLAAAMLTDGRLTRSWRGEVHRAFDLLDLVQHLCVDATEKQDLLSADSWRSIITKSRDEVEAMLDGCHKMLEREQVAARLLSSEGRGVRVREEVSMTAEGLRKKMQEVKETAFILGANLQEAVIARGKVEGGWKELSLLVGLGLLAPPCDARQLLPCCSNPRCAELAGDSEAGVVLRRCGGACGGAVAYCCAACQWAHWAAGHREECTAGRRRGGEKAGAAGTGKEG